MNLDLFVNVALDREKYKKQEEHIYNNLCNIRKLLAGSNWSIRINYLQVQTSIDKDIDLMSQRSINTMNMDMIKENQQNHKLLANKKNKLHQTQIFPPHFEICVITCPRNIKYIKSFNKWWARTCYKEVFKHRFIPLDDSRLLFGLASNIRNKRNKTLKYDIIAFYNHYYGSENFVINLTQIGTLNWGED